MSTTDSSVRSTPNGFEIDCTRDEDCPGCILERWIKECQQRAMRRAYEILMSGFDKISE